MARVSLSHYLVQKPWKARNNRSPPPFSLMIDQGTEEKRMGFTCNPTITAFKLSTGFQSSLRMFRQTFPSRSMLGW